MTVSTQLEVEILAVGILFESPVEVVAVFAYLESIKARVGSVEDTMP